MKDRDTCDSSVGCWMLPPSSVFLDMLVEDSMSVSWSSSVLQTVVQRCHGSFGTDVHVP